MTIDADLEPVFIPAGFQFLSADEHVALKGRVAAIKNATLAKGKKKIPKDDADSNLSSHWIMPLGNQLWSADVTVLGNGRVNIDEELPYSEILLETIRTRKDPVSGLHISDAGTFSRKAVRWLIAQEKNRENATVRWAVTDGAISKPVGIEFAHLNAGRNPAGIDQFQSSSCG